MTREEEIDEILQDGWAITLRGMGYCEGPKWWDASITAMGSIAPRQVEIEKAPTIRAAAARLREAITDLGGSHDVDWTAERLKKEIEKTEQRLRGLKNDHARILQHEKDGTSPWDPVRRKS